MVKTLLDQWTFDVAPEEGQIEFLIPAGTQHVNLSVRAPNTAKLHFVTADGEMLFLSQGDKLSISEDVEGHVALLLEVSGTYSFRGKYSKANWKENPDPQPVVITQKQTVQDNLRIAVASELRKHLQRLAESGVLQLSDEDADQMADDLMSDHEFEEDKPDWFVNNSYEEMEEEFPVEDESRQAVPPAEGPIPPAQPVQQPVAPPPAAQPSGAGAPGPIITPT